MVSNKITLVGRFAYVDFIDDKIEHVAAKIDTGADISSIWASDIRVDEDGNLRFYLFDKASQHYTGNEIVSKNFSVSVVRSSNGHEQLRYLVPLKIRINKRLIKGTFTLAKREKNRFPVLIGSKLLKGKFLVDVSLGYDEYIKIKRATRGDTLETDEVRGSAYYTKLSKADPKKFYEEHYLKNNEE